MASAGAQYTVFGFDSRIDWKPTVFVDGLPKTRVCSACGLVSARIALLPCSHLLCSRCYDGSGDEERNRCPLDKDVCQPDDVIWSTFTREKLFGRKIRCWNWRHGCDAVRPVCEIMDHFDDCRYHAVSCFRCLQSMPYKELAGHLDANNCTTPEANTASSGHGVPDAAFTLFSQAIGELREKLSVLQAGVHETKELISGHVQLSRERAATEMLVAESLQTLDNTLKESIGQSQAGLCRTTEETTLLRNSISTSMNALTEVLVLVKEMKTSLDNCAGNTTEISAACRNLQQNLDGLSASSTDEFGNTGKRLEALERIVHQRVNDELDMKDSLKRLNSEICEKLSVLVSGSKAILQNTLSISEPLTWTVEGWSELKKEASRKGVAIALVENPTYFYGYSIIPGVRLEKGDGDLTLHLYYHICQGEYDTLLAWPIKKILKFCVLDAEGTELPLCAYANTTINCFENFKMPANPKSGAVWSTQSINASYIEEKGSVQNDKVSVKLTVSSL